MNERDFTITKADSEKWDRAGERRISGTMYTVSKDGRVIGFMEKTASKANFMGRTISNAIWSAWLADGKGNRRTSTHYHAQNRRDALRHIATNTEGNP